MKIEIREDEIELEAESEHEKDALVKLHRAGEVKVKPGRSSDQDWPTDPRRTNVILKFPSQDWGT